MKDQNEEKIENHIRSGINKLFVNDEDNLWDKPVEKANASDWFLDSGSSKYKKSKIIRFITLAAACLIICVSTIFLYKNIPSASVYLDVNPSITLKVNYRNKVTQAIACNYDAEKILKDMDLKGTDMDVAIYAIIGSMVKDGYLTKAKDSVLVSVYSADSNRADELKIAVTDIVSKDLNDILEAGEVLSYQLDKDDVEDDDDDSTPGKSAFIDDLKQRYPQLSDKNLDSMTIDEIISLLAENKLDYSDYIDDLEDDDKDDDDIDDDDDEDLDDLDDDMDND